MVCNVDLVVSKFDFCREFSDPPKTPYLVDMKFVKEIMGGAFADVSIYTFRGREIAVKIPKKKHPKSAKMAENELRALTHLSKFEAHPNIVCFLGRLKDHWVTLLAFEFIPGGDLFEQTESNSLSEPEKQQIAFSVGAGLAHIQSKNVVHRDIKPENVLLDVAKNPKIIDFGEARVTSVKGEQVPGFVGTPHAMCPEVLLKKSQDYRGDWWSLGVLLYELFTGAHPFADPDESDSEEATQNVYKRVVTRTFVIPKEPVKIDFRLEDLLYRLLTLRPHERMCSEEPFAAHPFFKSKIPKPNVVLS